MSNIESINEYCDTLIKAKRYDIMNEGLFDSFSKNNRLLNNFEETIKKYDNASKSGSVPVYLSYEEKCRKIMKEIDRLKLSNQEKEKYESLKKRFFEIYERTAGKRILKDIENAKDFWDSGDPKYTSYEYGILDTLFALDISQDKIIKHFSNNKNIISLEKAIKIATDMFYDAEDSDFEYLPKMNKDDKCFKLYCTEDAIILYDYSIRKLIKIYYCQIDEINNIFDYTDNTNNIDKELYKKVASNNNISFN